MLDAVLPVSKPESVLLCMIISIDLESYLRTHSFDDIDKNNSTIAETNSSRHFRREIYVSRSINQIDQVFLVIYIEYKDALQSLLSEC